MALTDFIPGVSEAKLIAAVVAGALVFGAGFYTAWHWQAANLNAEKLAHTADMKRVSDEAAKAAADALARQQALESRITELDTTYAKELADARSQTDELRAAVADGTRKLRLRASCPAGGGGVPSAAASPGVGHDGAGRAELDPATAQSLVALAGEGDTWRAQLEACQAYVRTVISQSKGKAP